MNVIPPKIVSELIGTLTPDTQKPCIYRSYNHPIYRLPINLRSLVNLQQFIAYIQVYYAITGKVCLWIGFVYVVTHSCQDH